MVSDEDLENGSLYPPLNTIKEISVRVATKVAEFAYEKGKRHLPTLLFYL